MEFGVEVFGFEAWTETALLDSKELEEGLGRISCVLLGKCGGKRVKANIETNPVLGNTLVIWIEMVNIEKVETSVDKLQQVPFTAGLG